LPPRTFEYRKIERTEWGDHKSFLYVKPSQYNKVIKYQYYLSSELQAL